MRSKFRDLAGSRITATNVMTHMSLEDIYVRGHKRNVYVFYKFLESIEYIVCVSEDGMTPFELQSRRLVDGTWTQRFLDYGGYEYVDGTLFPSGFVFPEYSVAPYLQAEYLKCMVKNWNVTDYAFSTVAAIFVPTLKRFIRGLTGHFPDLVVDTALTTALADIARSPTNGRKDHNGTGQAPCLPEDLVRILRAMPTDLDFYEAQCFCFSYGLSCGPRSISVDSLINGFISEVVESTTTFSKVTKKPLLLVSLTQPKVKGNHNANKTTTIEGDVDTRSFYDTVYLLERFVIKKFGPKYSLRDHKTWSDVKLNPEWAQLKDLKLFHWGSPSAMSQCFNDRATRAGYPRGHFTFHSLRAGFLCATIINCNLSNSGATNDALVLASMVGGWVPGGTAQKRYIKLVMGECVVGSRLMTEPRNRPTTDDVGPFAREFLTSESFHGLKLKGVNWDRERLASRSFTAGVKDVLLTNPFPIAIADRSAYCAKGFSIGYKCVLESDKVLAKKVKAAVLSFELEAEDKDNDKYFTGLCAKAKDRIRNDVILRDYTKQIMDIGGSLQGLVSSFTGFDAVRVFRTSDYVKRVVGPRKKKLDLDRRGREEVRGAELPSSSSSSSSSSAANLTTTQLIAKYPDYYADRVKANRPNRSYVKIKRNAAGEIVSGGVAGSGAPTAKKAIAKIGWSEDEVKTLVEGFYDGLGNVAIASKLELRNNGDVSDKKRNLLRRFDGDSDAFFKDYFGEEWLKKREKDKSVEEKERTVGTAEEWSKKVRVRGARERRTVVAVEGGDKKKSGWKRDEGSLSGDDDFDDDDDDDDDGDEELEAWEEESSDGWEEVECWDGEDDIEEVRTDEKKAEVKERRKRSLSDEEQMEETKEMEETEEDGMVEKKKEEEEEEEEERIAVIKAAVSSANKPLPVVAAATSQGGGSPRKQCGSVPPRRKARVDWTEEDVIELVQGKYDGVQNVLIAQKMKSERDNVGVNDKWKQLKGKEAGKSDDEVFERYLGYKRGGGGK